MHQPVTGGGLGAGTFCAWLSPLQGSNPWQRRSWWPTTGSVLESCSRNSQSHCQGLKRLLNSRSFKRGHENVSKYIALHYLISPVFTGWGGGRNLCILCKGWREHLIQLPDLLVMETCCSLRFWLAAEVRRDNSSTVLGLALP